MSHAPRHLGRLAGLLAVLLVLTGAGLAVLRPADAALRPSDADRGALRGLVEEVTAARGHRYGAVDGTGRRMDAAKIVQAADGRYLAVYHSRLGDGRFHAAVATSQDLLHWHRRHDFGPGSSQPTLAQGPDGGFVLAWEQDPYNHFAVRHYPGAAALLAGRADRSHDAPRTLSSCSEGTPAISEIRGPRAAVVELTGHYRADCGTDRELRATLSGFTTWQTRPDRRLDTALLAHGTGGNIGDRDLLHYRGSALLLIEGQRREGDFGSWGTYVYDPAAGGADRARIRTHAGSTAFANPSATLLTAPDGRPSLLVSVFIPREGAAPGETGQLLYYVTL
ncbi:hypothetical protein ABZW18_14270 [Streptomyces sp. NPDC004647]|uniref:hypothetical protein n=1 Tax=Streptomyces sp. NPDC004647 TaxID=3154671 RepID=UPI0033AD84E9